MYLRDLAVWASDAAQMPAGCGRAAFNNSTHTPVEAYLDCLPRRQVVLHDFAKVNVALGPRPPKVRAFEDLDDVAILYWPWFDFSRYFRASRTKQQRRIIDVLHKALLRIASRTGSPTHWYHEAYEKLKQQPLPLPEITEDELRRRWGLLTDREKKAAKRRRRN